MTGEHQKPGTWAAIGFEIYKVDDLGNVGRILATARDAKIAAWMTDTHNSMLAAANNAKNLIEVLIDIGLVDPAGFLKTSMDSLNEAIAKAEG